MATWHTKLLASGLSLGTMFAASEIYLRAKDPLGTRYFDETYVYFTAMVPDTVVFYHHPANATQKYPSWSVTFNSDGLRGPELPVRKKAGTFRLLILGDSVAFGWGVPTPQTIGPRLAELIRARYGTEVEVVVDGVGSWNSVTQLRELYRRFDRLDPDAVLVLYCSNDGEIKPETPAITHGIPYDVAPRPLSHQLAWVKTLKGLGMLVHKPRKTPEEQKQEEEGELAAVVALGEIRRLTQALHLPMSVFSYQDEMAPQYRLRSEVQARGIPWLDASVDLPWPQMKRHSNSPLDGHFNGEGLRIFAEWTVQHLPPEFRSGPTRVGRVSRILLEGIDGDQHELPWGQRSTKGFVIPESPLFFLVRAVAPESGPVPTEARLAGLPQVASLPSKLPYGAWAPVLLDGERTVPLLLRLATPGTLEVTPAMLIHPTADSRSARSAEEPAR